MFKILFYLFLIINIFQINCVHSQSDVLSTESSDSLENVTTNSTEEEYEELDEDQEQEHALSLLERFKELHDQNRNQSIKLNVNHINDTFKVLSDFSHTFQSLIKFNGNPGAEIMELLTQIDIRLSSQCSASLFRIYSGVKNTEFWALKFLDSMGRFPPPGVIEGVQSSFGDFDECLDIRSPQMNENPNQGFSGKYCLLNIKLPFPSTNSYSEGEPIPAHIDFRLNLTKYYGLVKLSTIKALIETLNLANGTVYRFGICVPSLCSAEEIEDLLNKITYPVTKMPLEVEKKCYFKEQKIELDKYQWISITILSLLTLIVIISTGVEVVLKRCKYSQNESKQLRINSSKVLTVLLSFSLTTNIRKLMAKNERFGALDTIRLLMIIHIHLGHIYQYVSSIGLPALKKIYSDVMHKAFEDNSMVFARTPLPVDVLFTLSGFLLSYGLLRKLVKTKGRFNYFVFIFQRYIRFLVLMFGSILFFYLYPLTGSGPIWEEGVRKMINGCKNPSNLWKNVLFINNFQNEGNNFNDVKCHAVTWFLSALLQLTAISPIFVILFFKKPILGVYSLIIAIILSLFIAISPQLLWGIPPYLRIWELDSVIFSNSSSLAFYHTFPTVYLISFLVGFPFGFMLFRSVRFTCLQETLFWVLSIISIVSEYFWHNTFWRLDESASLMSALLWHSIGKLAFGLGIGWILFACSSKRAGYFNEFLSWNGFQPIARLSFGIYLLQSLVVSHRVFSVKTTYEMSLKYMLEHTIVDIIYDILLAAIFYLLIESPFSNIFDAIFNRKSGEKYLAKNLDQNNNNNNEPKSVSVRI